MLDLGAETQRPTATTPSEETLAQMGMSKDLFEKVKQERAEREKNTGIARNNGETLYQEMSRNPEGTFTVIPLAQGGMELSPIHSPEELLPTVKDRLEALKSSGATPPPKEELDAFLEGFAKEALKDGRIKTGFDCFDFISPQGIINNQTGVEEIKAIVSNSTEYQFDATLYLWELKQKSANQTRNQPPETLPPVTPDESPQPTPIEGPTTPKSPFDLLRPAPTRQAENQPIGTSNPQDSAT